MPVATRQLNQQLTPLRISRPRWDDQHTADPSRAGDTTHSHFNTDSAPAITREEHVE